jgi:type II restriction enzyme
VCQLRSKTLDGEERSRSRNAANVFAASVSVLFDAFRINFKCAAVIYDFCGFLVRVKTVNVPECMKLPSTILGAASGGQSARMSAGIYFPSFLVLIDRKRRFAIDDLPADLQHRNYFKPRRPLSKNVCRAGWRGFTYDLRAVSEGAIVRINP